eukprot:UN19072
MYLSCLKLIFDVKKCALFHEHSPTLYSLIKVPSWNKITDGMLKMYIAEVLMKFPVIQRFYFGSLLTIELPIPKVSVGKMSAQTRNSMLLIQKKNAELKKLNEKWNAKIKKAGRNCRT